MFEPMLVPDLTSPSTEPAPFDPQAILKQLQQGRPGLAASTVRGWYRGCIYLEGEKFTGSPEQIKRILEVWEQLADGRWQTADGKWWLSQRRALKALGTVVFRETPKAAEDLTLTEAWLRLRSWLRYWQHRGGKKQDFLRRACGQTSISEDAVSLILAWRALPAGHYGDADDPALDAPRAAEFLNCSLPGIYDLEERGLIKSGEDSRRNGNQPIKTFRIADLKALKGKLEQYQGDGLFVTQEGTRRTIPAAAKKHGIPVSRLRQAVKKNELQTEGLFATRMADQPTVSDKEVVSLKNQIKSRLRRGKRGGYAEFSEPDRTARDQGGRSTG
jgi:hypothetical protein